MSIDKLDGWEAETIEYNKTLVPNGYNVTKHSRVKNRDVSNIDEYYINISESLEVKPIREKGLYKIVYIYIKLLDPDKEKVRLTFGQSDEDNFEKAVNDALSFIAPFKEKGIPVTIHPDILGKNDPLSSIYKKIASYENKNVLRITVTKNKHGDFYTIVLYIYCENESKKKVSFGGEKIKLRDAYETANKFIQRIINKNTKVEETKILQEFLKSATGSC